MNSVALIGRMTRDVELRRTNSGKAVASFTLAVNRDKETADFINCIAWNKTAEILAQYTSKGHKVGVEGRIQTRTYDDNNGKKVYVTEVVANRIELLESKPQEKQEEKQVDNSFTIDEADLPF